MMLSTRKLLVLPVLLIALSAGGYFLYRHEQSLNRPIMRIDHTKLDLGPAKEGEDRLAAFEFFNDGRKALDIIDVKTDCGCTDLSWKSKRIDPGKSAKLTVHVDTTMKQGPVTKQVRLTTNDPERAFASLNIYMQVENLHSDMGAGGVAKIFADEKCAHCHVDQGVGAFGKELFEADCAMCHRPGKESKIVVGPLLEARDYSDKDYVRHVEDVIAHGSKTHRSMPGFLETAGGPLTKEQIASLVAYLKTADEKGQLFDNTGGPQ